jgi:hypothetical protein
MDDSVHGVVADASWPMSVKMPVCLDTGIFKCLVYFIDIRLQPQIIRFCHGFAGGSPHRLSQALDISDRLVNVSLIAIGGHDSTTNGHLLRRHWIMPPARGGSSDRRIQIDHIVVFRT